MAGGNKAQCEARTTSSRTRSINKAQCEAPTPCSCTWDSKAQRGASLTSSRTWSTKSNRLWLSSSLTVDTTASTSTSNAATAQTSIATNITTSTSTSTSTTIDHRHTDTLNGTRIPTSTCSREGTTATPSRQPHTPHLARIRPMATATRPQHIWLTILLSPHVRHRTWSSRARHMSEPWVYALTAKQRNLLVKEMNLSPQKASSLKTECQKRRQWKAKSEYVSDCCLFLYSQKPPVSSFSVPHLDL